MFRVKKGKKHEQDTRSTLDKLHTNVIESRFDTAELQNKLKSTTDPTERATLESEIKRRQEAWKEYYLKNGNILLKYYDDKQTNAITVDSFFQEKKPSNSFNQTGKEQLLESYLKHTETNYIPKTMYSSEEAQLCPGCGSTYEDMYSDGLYVCSRCGTQQNVMTVSDVPSYKEPHHEKQNFNYRRINHFTEIMNQIQAKETTEISPEVMEKIQAEIRKQRITDVSKLQRDDIRAILRKINEDDYYEHSQFIISRLTGKPPPPIPPHILEKMNTLFNEAQSLWFVHRPNHRSNFIGYNYVIYKLFELLDLDDYKQYCPLLKTRDKLVEYDHVWRNICKDLKWEFIPTV